jgi:hypothetical protein
MSIATQKYDQMTRNYKTGDKQTTCYEVLPHNPQKNKNNLLMFQEVHQFHSDAKKITFIGTDEHHTGSNCYVTQHTLHTMLNFTVSDSFFNTLYYNVSIILPEDTPKFET